MVTGGMSCIKYLLFAFNLVFFLIGLALIVIGALVQAHVTQYTVFLGDLYGGAILVIVVGAIIFVIGFFGCCGAMRENQCMMRTFGVFLAIILVLEVIAGVLGFVFRAQIETVLEQGMLNSMPKYQIEQQVTSLWNDVQMSLHCCGVYNASDWVNVGKFSPSGSVPDSCCKTMSTGCGVNVLLKPNPQSVIYINGCVTSLESTLKSSATIVGIAALCFAAVQLLGILFACCMASAIKKEYEMV